MIQAQQQQADGYSRNLDVALEEEFFDIAVTPWEAVVEPDGMRDDGQRESIAG
jgi:hypothetical protein